MTPDILTGDAERELLARLASVVPRGQCVVELGVFRGGSLAVLAEHAHVPVYGVDTFGSSGTPAYYEEGSDWIKWWEHVAGRSHRWSEDEVAARTAAPYAHLIVEDTAKVGRAWMGPPVGLLYIDADHSYDGVKRDWAAWLPNLAPGAAVVFDDYMYRVRKKDHYPGVTKLVDELGLAVERIGKAALVRP